MSRSRAEVERAIGFGARYARSIVLLGRAAAILREVRDDLAGAQEVERIHTTIEILTGAAEQAVMDLAMGVDGPPERDRGNG